MPRMGDRLLFRVLIIRILFEWMRVMKEIEFVFGRRDMYRIHTMNHR